MFIATWAELQHPEPDQTENPMSVTQIEAEAASAALAIAKRGPRGLNPQVGAVFLAAPGVVVADSNARAEAVAILAELGFTGELLERVLALGWHEGAGTAHAEVAALNKLGADAASGATAVVSLEPCNHTGRTGPCALALTAANVARVIYLSEDPGEVTGGGAQTLRANGIETLRADEDLVNQADALIADWVHLNQNGLPFITLKWAQSLDGRAAASDGSSKWITGPDARRDVHLRRSAADVIVAGTGTVLADNPALTARDDSGALLANQPAPVVIGSREIPESAQIWQHPKPLQRFKGGELLPIMRELAAAGVQRVFVEGGPALISSFLSEGLVDEVLCYVAPVLLGGNRTAIGDIQIDTIQDALRLEFAETVPLGPDVLFIARPATARQEVLTAPKARS